MMSVRRREKEEGWQLNEEDATGGYSQSRPQVVDSAVS